MSIFITEFFSLYPHDLCWTCFSSYNQHRVTLGIIINRSSFKKGSRVSIADMLASHPTFLLALLLFSAATVFAGIVPAHVVPRAAPGKYFAQGDPYASGIAAGNYVDGTPGSADWTCSRFTSAYGIQLNGLFGGAADFQHQACSGATSAAVRQNQIIDADADLATLTVGGNDADFGNIVDKCVYGFTPNQLNDASCQAALAATEKNIDNNVNNAVYNTVLNIVQKALKPGFELYLTSYPRFWNENTTQCNSVSFNYWSGPDTSYTMTQERRAAMNRLTLKLNSQLASVVKTFNTNSYPNVHIIDIDTPFQGHRFCEDGITEPQQPSQDNSNTWIFQYNTPVGSIDQTTAGNGGANTDGANYFQELKTALGGGTTVNPLYAAWAVNVDDYFGSSGGLPLVLSKLFHLTTPGHAAIANAINAAIGSNPGGVNTVLAAPPSNPQPTSTLPVVKLGE